MVEYGIIDLEYIQSNTACLIANALSILVAANRIY